MSKNKSSGFYKKTSRDSSRKSSHKTPKYSLPCPFPNITIRPAQPCDLRNISYVWHASYLQKERAIDTPPTEQEMERMYRNEGRNIFETNWEQKNNRFLVASVPTHKLAPQSLTIPDQKKAVAGMCEFSQESIRYDGDQYMDALYIERLYTIKTQQCPVGKALMSACLDIAEKSDVKAIVLDAVFASSRQWYEQEIGFQRMDSMIWRPDSNHPHLPKASAMILYRDNFSQAKARLTTEKPAATPIIAATM